MLMSTTGKTNVSTKRTSVQQESDVSTTRTAPTYQHRRMDDFENGTKVRCKCTGILHSYERPYRVPGCLVPKMHTGTSFRLVIHSTTCILKSPTPQRPLPSHALLPGAASYPLSMNNNCTHVFSKENFQRFQLQHFIVL